MHMRISQFNVWYKCKSASSFWTSKNIHYYET